jgi:hypothetical protein
LWAYLWGKKPTLGKYRKLVPSINWASIFSDIQSNNRIFKYYLCENWLLDPTLSIPFKMSILEVM